MKIYILLIVLVRTFTQTVVNTYNEENQMCKHILSKALEEDIPSVKSAYFLKVMEEDQKAVLDTLNKYKIGFLASNATYATEEEIETQACNMPFYVTEALDWTAGITPLCCAWIAYSIFVFVATKCKRKPVFKTPERKKDQKPPRAPRKEQRTDHMNYIRASKEVQIPKESFAGKIIQNISPSLRKRMMPADV